MHHWSPDERKKPECCHVFEEKFNWMNTFVFISLFFLLWIIRFWEDFALQCLHIIIFFTFVSTGYTDMSSFCGLCSTTVKAELVVVMELLDSVSGPAACGGNGILFSWEDV